LKEDFDYYSDSDSPELLRSALSAVMANPAPPADPKAKAKAATRLKLENVLTTFRKWMHLPDAGALETLLGCIAANLQPGDPVWILLIGPPGGGKTELLQPFAVLPNVHLAGTLTEPALLSGTPAKDKSSDSKGGLLRQIGSFGFILMKDFTSVLSMHRDSRAAVLAALREIYDGNWTRHVGVDGGRTLAWSGKVALMAGCTPTIDSHHSVMAAMGERFILYRLPAIDENEQARRALSHDGKEATMRAELSRAIASLFSGLDVSIDGPRLDNVEQNRMIALATLAVRCRSAVERDGHSREVELIPDSEAPGRLALALSRLLGGMSIVGIHRVEAWRVVQKVALDCMPALRRKVFAMLTTKEGPVDTADVATEIRYPTQTTRRALEDLTAHGVVTRLSQGQGKADLWELSHWSQRKCQDAGLTFPEMSQGTEADEP